MSRMFNLKELLEGKQSVALGGHVRPDGDCVGSTMGLYLYLKENFPQIETDLYLESVPDLYNGMPLPTYVPPAEPDISFHFFSDKKQFHL